MILVTAFGPYQHHRMNASGVLVESLRRELPDELAGLRDRLAFEVLRCEEISRESEHQSLEAQLAELLVRHRPTVCIHTGQAPAFNKVTIEKIAINSFLNEIIDPDLPAAYWSTLPGADALRDVLEREHIPADYSFYCGQHQCNHILFSSLHFAEMNANSHQAGFIHIPLLPEQVTQDNRDAPYMPLEMSRKALALVIRHVAEALG
jgi:pyroglutamyl-peptidase